MASFFDIPLGGDSEPAGPFFQPIPPEDRPQADAVVGKLRNMFRGRGYGWYVVRTEGDAFSLWGASLTESWARRRAHLMSGSGTKYMVWDADTFMRRIPAGIRHSADTNSYVLARSHHSATGFEGWYARDREAIQRYPWSREDAAREAKHRYTMAEGIEMDWDPVRRGAKNPEQTRWSLYDVYPEDRDRRAR